MINLPEPSIASTLVGVHFPRNHSDILHDVCRRNGTNVNRMTRELWYKYLETVDENQEHPSVKLTPGDIFEIWSAVPAFVKSSACQDKPTCNLCGKEQEYLHRRDVPGENGYAHWWRLPYKKPKCVCANCLLALAIRMQTPNGIGECDFRQYRINTYSLQHTDRGREILKKLNEARLTYFLNAPSVTDATDEEVLSCYSMERSRGLIEKLPDYETLWEQSNRPVVNYKASGPPLTVASAYLPTVRYKRVNGEPVLYGYSTADLLSTGREILSRPSKACRPVKFAKGLTFDANELVLTRSIGHALFGIADKFEEDVVPMQSFEKQSFSFSEPAVKPNHVVRLEVLEGDEVQNPRFPNAKNEKMIATGKFCEDCFPLFEDSNGRICYQNGYSVKYNGGVVEGFLKMFNPETGERTSAYLTV